MFWPRRSDPLPSNFITANRAPCGMVGSVTASSALFLPPEGLSVRNQISAYAVPLFVILVPFFSRAPAIPGARSEGGGPAGSALYCATAEKEQSARTAIRYRINFR